MDPSLEVALKVSAGLGQIEWFVPHLSRRVLVHAVPKGTVWQTLTPIQTGSAFGVEVALWGFAEERSKRDG
jgi:hypothetical protein